jgi:L-malate glycosyltransferase
MTRHRVLIMPEWYPSVDHPYAGVFCQDQARTVAMMHDVVVLTWVSDPRVSRPFTVTHRLENGVPTYQVRFRQTKVPKLGFAVKMLGIASVLYQLRRHSSWTPDVIHAHEYTAGVPALAVGRLGRVPVVVSEHASDVARGRLDSRQRRLATRVFRHADVVCPVSRDLSRRLAPLANGSRLIPVPNPVDTSVFRPRPRSSNERLRLLSVGNLVEVKGHRHLLDAFAALLRSGVDAALDVVGVGVLETDLRQQAAAVAPPGRVRFHGALSRHAVAAMMRSTDVFVLPSLWENMPCVLIEAMASGVPCVATRVGGVPEVVDRTTGLLVEPGSPEALTAAMLEMVRIRHNYEPAKLHDLAVSRYGHRAIGYQWTQVYEVARAQRQRDRE